MVVGTKTHVIKILLNYVTKGIEKANAAAKKTNQAVAAQQRGYADATKTGKRHIETTRNSMIANANAGQVMQMNQEVLGKYNKEGRRFNTFQARAANRFRMMTHGARGFRMEMLGVMFFGMAMNRVFMGLLRTSMEWMGIMELLSLSLGVLFLPIAEVVLDWALKFLNWVMNLTDTQKKTIGWFVLVGAAVGGLLFLIGTLALGIGSMILAFNFSKVATMIGGSGLGGISTAAGAAATKVSGLTSNLFNLVKYAGVGIAIAMTVKDLNEGQLTAAIGSATLAVGIYTGNPYLIGVGIALKLIGEPEFLAKIFVFFMKIVDTALYFGEQIGEALWAGITGKEFKFDFGGLGESILRELAKTEFRSEAISGLSDKLLPSASGLGFVPTLENAKGVTVPTGNVITNINYDVNVSDKKEFEIMLEENNRQLTEDFRRVVGG